MTQPPAIVSVYFAGSELRPALDEAVKRGLDSLWLLRDRESICWVLPGLRKGMRVMPSRITRLIPGIDVFPDVGDDIPFVEDVPLHNCVFRALSKLSEDSYHHVHIQLQFNLTYEFRMFLRKTPPCPLETLFMIP